MAVSSTSFKKGSNSHTGDLVLGRVNNPTGKGGWPKGVSGHPQGHPSAGYSIIEWFNLMAGWPIERVREVAKDKSEKMAKRAAAKEWIKVDEGSSNSLDRILDRSVGRPKQTVEMNGQSEVTHTHTHEVRAMMDLVDKDPEARKALDLLANRQESQN